MAAETEPGSFFSACHRGDADSFCTCIAQDSGALGHGGAGGHDVIDEQHGSPLYSFGAAHAEGIDEVPFALASAQLGLGRGEAGPGEGAWLHRKVQMLADLVGQQLRLIEAALELAPPVEGHGHKGLQIPGEGLTLYLSAEELPKWNAEEAAPAVLESVDQLPQRAGVFAERGGATEVERLAAAGGADPFFSVRPHARSTAGALPFAHSLDVRPALRTQVLGIPVVEIYIARETPPRVHEVQQRPSQRMALGAERGLWVASWFGNH